MNGAALVAVSAELDRLLGECRGSKFAAERGMVVVACEGRPVVIELVVTALPPGALAMLLGSSEVSP